MSALRATHRLIPDLFPFSVVRATENANERPGQAREPGIPGRASARA
jgi:hypothetical protein